MSVAIAVAIAVVFSAGFYLMMRPGLLNRAFGLILISHGANFVIMTMAGLRSNPRPPILPVETAVVADPLPQALILTALVIGFAVFAFLWALVLRLGKDEHR